MRKMWLFALVALLLLSGSLAFAEKTVVSTSPVVKGESVSRSKGEPKVSEPTVKEEPTAPAAEDPVATDPVEETTTASDPAPTEEPTATDPATDPTDDPATDPVTEPDTAPAAPDLIP